MAPQQLTLLAMDNLALAKETLAGLSRFQWLVVGVEAIVFYTIARCVYLLYFHPLAKYPGPRIAAVSNAWYAYHWFYGRYPWAIEAALEKYGDVVRVAPNDVVFVTPQAYKDIYASTSQNRELFKKTNFQDIGEKEVGITAQRDPDVHRDVRRQLAPAFSTKALQVQEVVLHEHVNEFVYQIENYGTSGAGINITEWFDWLTFDIAGDMGYGHSFDSVKNAKPSFVLTTLLSVGFFAMINQVMKRFPTFYPLLYFAIPSSMKKTLPILLQTNREEVHKRVQRRHELKHPDYLTMLIPENSPAPSEAWLVAQANEVVVAGFDPHTNLFTSCVYFLLKEPETLRKLNKELRDEFSTMEDMTHDRLVKLKYLHAVIEEALRIHTNGAFGLPRTSPGALVDGHYIPKGVTVQTSFFATTHSERYFARPRTFHPERWLPQSHPDYDQRFASDAIKSAFHPFSLGPRGCIGMNVGYMEARIVLAKLAWYFDWELMNGSEVDWERDCKLYAMWEKPDVYVKFTKVAR